MNYHLRSFSVMILAQGLHLNCKERGTILDTCLPAQVTRSEFARLSRETEVKVVFQPQNNMTHSELKGVALRFCNEVLDQQIRYDLERKYAKIRDLIVEHAFFPLKSLKDNMRRQPFHTMTPVAGFSLHPMENIQESCHKPET
jgi:His-Xaa-Ser system protein HxsD